MTAATDAPASPNRASAIPRAEDLTLEQRVRLLSGASTWLTQPIREARVPTAFLADGPHGLRVRPDATDLGVGGSLPATCFPTAVTLGSTWDPDLVRRVGRAIGAEAREIGVDVVLGPGLNIKRSPLGGRNFEYFSEDPLVSGQMAAALTSGIQDAGVGGCLKHYAVNNQESHRFVVDVRVDERTLREIYLRGFEIATRQAHPWTVMCAYNLVNGTHATEHAQLLDILRAEWGFDGLVMSDWGAVADRVAGVLAGMDLEMPGGSNTWDAEVLTAVAQGRLSEQAVTTCAQRVLDLVARVPGRGVSQASHVTEATLAANDALAREAAAAGSVLLRNQGALPLARNTKVAVIGAFAAEPRIQGSGSSLVNSARLTTMLAELAARKVDFTYVAGYDPLTSPDDAAALTEAILAAQGAQVAVVLVGLPPVIESEGFDRDSLALPPQHDALVTAVSAANPNTVVVLLNGAPVAMPWRERVAAILEVYLGGQAGGGAIVDLLFGDAEPGGRLAETFPAQLSDLPASANFPGDPHQVVYRERLQVGYRGVSAEHPPVFPFGFGLSYTTFSWTDITAQVQAPVDGLTAGVTISVTVTNTGPRAGSDVVQVYLRDRTGLVDRPSHELAAFAKVHLAPGGSSRVSLAVPQEAFRFWDATAHAWRVPTGVFEVAVARSSADVAAILPVEVVGDVTEPVAEVPLPTPPQPRPVRPFTRESTVAELEGSTVGRQIAKVIRKGAFPGEEDPVTKVMVERSVGELPIRAGAMFSNGKLTLPMVDSILDAANGQPQHIVGRVADRIRRR